MQPPRNTHPLTGGGTSSTSSTPRSTHQRQAERQGRESGPEQSKTGRKGVVGRCGNGGISTSAWGNLVVAHCWIALLQQRLYKPESTQMHTCDAPPVSLLLQQCLCSRLKPAVSSTAGRNGPQHSSPVTFPLRLAPYYTIPCVSWCCGKLAKSPCSHGQVHSPPAGQAGSSSSSPGGHPAAAGGQLQSGG